MKRLLAILFAVAVSAMAVGAMRHETNLVRASGVRLRAEESTAAASLTEIQSTLVEAQRNLSSQKVERAQLAGRRLDPQLTEWLLQGDYGRISSDLLAKLSTALGLQWAEPTNDVLVAKSTLPQLKIDYNGGANLLGDTECGILSITSEERQQIESAFAATRQRFNDWARGNVQRETPGTNTLLSYTIPASPELAKSLTNSLFTVIADAIGPERAPLLWEYKEYWFGLEIGHFGSVANTLLIVRDPLNHARSDLWYMAAGHGGPIVGEAVYGTYGTFSNAFGSLPEILAREGIPIPKEQQDQLSAH